MLNDETARPEEGRAVMIRAGVARPISWWITLAAAISLLAVTLGIAGRPHDVRAATGSSAGQVYGTGMIDLGSTTQTVTLDLMTDLSNPPSGTFEISDGTTSAAGEVTCLFLSGSTAVIGVYLPVSGIWGLLAIVDNSPATDTLWLDNPTSSGPVDCTTSPLPGTTLTTGDFTVAMAPSPSATPPASSATPPASSPTPPTSSPTPPTSSPTPSSDANLDGIADSLQPAGTPAGSFVDESLTPPTSGSIVATGGLTVTITDAPNPLDGVLITVGAGAPGQQVELSVCGGFTILLDPGTVTTGTCGSVTLEVAAGTATVVLGGSLATLSVPADGAARVVDNGDGTFAITNLGATAIALTVDGTTTEIPAGGGTTAAAWDFIGFAEPIDAAPVLNRVKAGQAVPVRWKVLDAAGTPVTNLTSATITVTSLSCAVGTTVDLVEEAVSGATGLMNLGDGYYQVNWKSPTSYAGSCKTLRLDIGDGVLHDALFQFTR